MVCRNFFKSSFADEPMSVALALNDYLERLSSMQYIPYFITHKEEFEIIGAKNDPNHKRIPKANATKEGIQSLYRFEVECEDEMEILFIILFNFQI